MIWYEILFTTNAVRKYSQSKNMRLDVAIKHLNELLPFLEKIDVKDNKRLSGFKSALVTPTELLGKD